MSFVIEYAKKRFDLYFDRATGTWYGPMDGAIPVMIVNDEEVYAADVALAIAYDDDNLDRSADAGWEYIFDICELGLDIDPRWCQAIYILHRQKTYEAMEDELDALQLVANEQPWKFDPHADAEPLIMPIVRFVKRAAGYIAKHLKIAVDRNRYRG